MKQLHNVSNISELTGLKPHRIYELCRLGLFPHVHLGRQIRFDPDAVEAFIISGGQALPGGWRQEEAAK